MHKTISDRSDSSEYVIGVDLGGSKIAVALVSKNGHIEKYTRIPTEAHQGKDRVIHKIKRAIDGIIKESRIEIEAADIMGIGIGIPGQVEPKTGIVRFAPNLPQWENVYLKKILYNAFHVPVLIENDGNAAAWGERSFGIARGMNDMICLTLGTGIGGGIISEGKIVHGKHSYAGEVGHMVVNKDGPPCGCGGYGCLEAYSSASGIRNRISEKIKTIKKTDTHFVLPADVDLIGLAEIFQQARQGNPLFADIVQNAIEYLGVAIVSLVNLLNPEMVVLVGGMANEGEKLLNPLKEIVFNRAMKCSLRGLKIGFGQLGEHAGVIGAAALLWK